MGYHLRRAYGRVVYLALRLLHLQPSPLVMQVATNLQGSTGQTKSRSSNRHTRGTVNVLAPSHENCDHNHDATHDDTQFLRRQDIPTLVQEVLKSLSPSNTNSTTATMLNVGQQDTPETTVTIHEEITIGTAVRTTTVAA